MKFLFIILSLFPALLFAESQWNQKAPFPGIARHRASAFVIGDKAYVGMGHYNSGEHVIFNDIWEYDPATNSWTQKADFGGTTRYQCSAFSIDNFGYLGLGRNTEDNYEKDFWKFDPLANMWYPIGDIPGVARRGATAFVIDKKAYVGLGQTDGGYAVDFYKFDPSNNQWEQVADFIGVQRTSAVSFVYNGKAYVGTGHTYGEALKDFYEYNPSSDYWLRKADVGDTLRQDATGFCLMGKGYIGTGNNVDGSVNYKDFWQYDFETENWKQINDFEGSARRYMVSFVINNTAYCYGGTNGTNLNDLWSFDPLLSVDQNIEISEVKVYPNPATEQINFDLSNLTLENISLEIFNLNGQLIDQFSPTKNLNTYSNSDLLPGFYLYVIRSEHELIKQGKITITY
ncbi:MAG: Kelch repeat-containing protein [Putridiphycobacter sp.]